MMHCPSCSQAMVAENFSHRQGGDVTVDICYPCNAIWFDHMESVQLSPGGVIELFKKIHAHKSAGHRALSDRMGCVHCRKPLNLVSDMQRTGRFSYTAARTTTGALRRSTTSCAKSSLSAM